MLWMWHVACGTRGREETYIKYKGMGPLGRPSHRWEGKIKMGLKI